MVACRLFRCIRYVWGPWKVTGTKINFSPHHLEKYSCPFFQMMRTKFYGCPILVFLSWFRKSKVCRPFRGRQSEYLYFISQHLFSVRYIPSTAGTRVLFTGRGIKIKKKRTLLQSPFLFRDSSGLCESGVILLIINLLVDVIEKQCTTVCTTFSALFWRAKLPWFITTCESITKLTLIIRIFTN